MAAVNDRRPARAEETASAPTWVWLLLVVFIGASVVIGIQAAPILAGLVFPPTIEPPPGVMLRSHINPTYGVDEWVYTVTGSACAVLQHYADLGAECAAQAREAALSCDPQTPSVDAIFDFTCSGAIDFSIFQMNWSARLSGADLMVHRAIDWTGASRTGVPAASDDME